MANFIEWIKKQEFDENTTIVIVGDHLTMDSDFIAKNVNKNYNRTIYNTFINSAVTTEKTTNRYFTTIDMYPTVWASLGVKIDTNKLGLGTNLFSDEETLVEKYGINQLSKELSKKSNFHTNNLMYGIK